MNISLILEFFKVAFRAFLEIIGYPLDDEFVDNVDSAIKDVVDFGNSVA